MKSKKYELVLKMKSGNIFKTPILTLHSWQTCLQDSVDNLVFDFVEKEVQSQINEIADWSIQKTEIEEA